MARAVLAAVITFLLVYYSLAIRGIVAMGTDMQEAASEYREGTK
jgi:hypothetical protein